jgi:hypothetical protein
MSDRLFRVTQIRLHHVVDELRKFHVVPLDQTLSSDYYVVFHCAPDPDNNEGYQPSRTSFRLVADPSGTGDLGSSGGNFLVVENQSNTSRAPRVHMTIVECLDGSDPNGFRLRDIKAVQHTASTTTGLATYSDTVSGVSDFKQCWVIGGMWGGGAGGGSALSSNITREYLTSNTDLEITKFANASFVLNADMITTCQVVEWGSNWEVYRQDFGLVNVNPSFEDPAIYTQHTIVDWDGNPKPLDFDHTMMHLSWHSEANNGRLHNQIPIVRPGNGLASTMQGEQSTIAAINAVNAAGSFQITAYTASNPEMSVSHFTPQRGTIAMPRVEQVLTVPAPIISAMSEVSDSASSGVDLNFSQITGARFPIVQYTGDSTTSDNNNDGPMIAGFSLEGEQFTYSSISAATGDDNSHLYVQIADMTNLKKQVVVEPMPTLDEAGKKGIPGLKALVVRELFEIDELVDHVDGRIVGTHEQVKPGDEGSSVKMPRVIVEAISGNARWHGGVQTVTVAVYVYSRDGYSDAARMYELVRTKLQHTRLNRDGFSPRGIIRETERPHDGYNQQVDGYFIRGLFTYVGTL